MGTQRAGQLRREVREPQTRFNVTVARET